MSHFALLVILPKEPTKENKLLEKTLQPFHCYEVDGVFDCYVEFEEWYDYDDDVYHDGEDLSCSDLYQSAAVDGYDVFFDGKIGRYTNPLVKWDFWEIGGNWKGKLFSKNSNDSLDICKASDLDLEKIKKSVKKEECILHFTDTFLDDLIEISALSCFAVYSREDGWLEKDKEIQDDEWRDKIYNMLKNLKPEQWVVIVDCHI